jgi:malate permease and related proteins
VFATLVAIIAPILIVSAIGFVWGRSGRPFDANLVTALVTTIGTPCLIASTLTKFHPDAGALGTMALVTLLCFVAYAGIGVVLLRLLKLPYHSYLPALMFSNCGNMGLPLALFAFGEKGLGFAIVFFVISATLQFTVGVGIASGSADWRRLLRMPLIYAVAASLVFLATGWAVPRWLANTLELLGGLTIPLMLVALGVSLAQLKVHSLKRAVGMSLLRLGLGFAVGVGLAHAFGLEREAAGVVILQSSMPVAVFNYLFAKLYERAAEDVAGMVVVSTIMSFATLPFLLLLVL